MSKPPTRRNTHPRPDKVRAQKRGQRAEALVAWGLRLKGWRILARNYKTHLGELDLIAKRGNLICFVEVKARTNVQTGLDAISAHQRGRIQRAAEQYLMQHPPLQVCDIRFDVALVTGFWRFSYIMDAWRP